MAPVPTLADVILPLSKTEKDNHYHEFPATVSFQLKEDTECTPEQIAIIEEGLILSCNKAHDKDTFRMTKAAVKKAAHSPFTILAATKTALRTAQDDWP